MDLDINPWEGISKNQYFRIGVILIILTVVNMYKTSRINFVALVMHRLREIIIHLRKNFLQAPVMYPFFSQFNNSNHSMREPLLAKKQSFPLTPSRKNLDSYQTTKLNQVNEIMLTIQASLGEVATKLEQIYQKMQQSAMYYQKSRLNYENKLQFKQSRFDPQVYKQGYKLKIFQDLFQYIHNTFFNESFQQLMSKPAKKIAVYLLSAETKLSFLPLMIHQLPHYQPDIATYYPYQSKYSHAWKNIRFMDKNHKQQSQSFQMSYFKKIMMMTTSAVVTQSSTQGQIFGKILFGASFPIFWFADDQANLRCYKLWRNPKIQNVNKLWNLPQTKLFSSAQKILYPAIQTNFFIYVPAPLNNSNIYPTNNMQLQIQQQLPQIFTYPQSFDDIIRVQVLCHDRLIFNQPTRNGNWLGCFPTSFRSNQNYQTIMIYIPGGGFVSLSSQTSQAYTRKWSNQLKIPIFSIDYRKPPKFRFPIAVEDCFTAYKFIVERINSYFNVRPKNIILSGDSSGGNLATSLCALLLQRKYPILPTGIFLAYPAVDLRMKFSPSRMNSFHEPFLLPSLLIMCLREYLGQNTENQNNPLASPLLLSQYFIQTGNMPSPSSPKQSNKWPKNWPSTTIVVGKKDPLYDDSLRMIQKMCQAGVDARLLIYNQFSHAFLGMASMIPECSVAIDDGIEQIRRLIRQ